MDAAQIKHMVDRFLRWSFPENFNPDGGISFVRSSYKGALYPMPVGTNLLDAVQAEAMVRHMVEGLPSARAPDLHRALKLAVGHIEHMSQWIGESNKSAKWSNEIYSFEALGEDMPDIRAALTMTLPKPNRNRTGKAPCGECHLQSGEICDICGATHIDPTTFGDCVADEVRRWYEANRETWWSRRKRRDGAADEFILSLISEVHRVEEKMEGRS